MLHNEQDQLSVFEVKRSLTTQRARAEGYNLQIRMNLALENKLL